MTETNPTSWRQRRVQYEVITVTQLCMASTSDYRQYLAVIDLIICFQEQGRDYICP